METFIQKLIVRFFYRNVHSDDVAAATIIILIVGGIAAILIPAYIQELKRRKDAKKRK